jgi:ATP-dependent HslUV protease ATP-binding subunit HslU
MTELTPQQVVQRLDEHIIGQDDAKRSVAIALRNRWRWKQLTPEMRREVTPKNIIMIGPTGVGKTEITRRLANLTGAPFVKVEATKYTEVGYYGRDVESMIRDLVEAAIALVKVTKREQVRPAAEERVEKRLLDLLVPTSDDLQDDAGEDATARRERIRQKFREMLQAGQLEDRKIEVSVEQKQMPIQVLSNMGLEQMDVDFQNMFEKILPKQKHRREMSVADARKLLLEQEMEALLDRDAIHEEAIHLAEDTGMVFIDEIDKVCGPEEGSKNADVSRQGVQRDLLPIVEGTSVQTKYGNVRTDHMLFIAAGAFHRSRPADLMPELQGRFPLRVELHDLTRDDFLRILTEPTSSLTRQYEALLKTDGVTLKFEQSGLEELADIAWQVNQSTQNIGARRLHTILERLLEDVSFRAPEDTQGTVVIDAEYVREKLSELIKHDDLSKFIL